MIEFDFRKIEKEFPKAFALLKEWIAKENHCAIHEMDGVDILDGEFMIDNGGYECAPTFFNPLELDFFFDEQNIFGGNISRRVHDGKFSISTLQEFFDTRSEALAALWLKEFSILESQQEGSEGK